MRLPIVFALFLLAASAEPRIGPPPASLNADPFYAKYLDAGGIPVLGSARAPDLALATAAGIVDGMLAHRPDLRAALVQWKVRVAVMAREESTTDLPEQRHWKKPARSDPRLTRCERKHYEVRIGALSDREYWDRRARGMAGMLVNAASENLLGLPGTRYYGENIFVHEFSHDVLMAIEAVDKPLYARVERAYRDALAAGRWKDEYASTSVQEYWAEGSQFWFNSNKLAAFDGRAILSDADLRAYDPALYALLGEAYGPRHRIAADVFFEHPARVPPGPLPRNTAEEC